MGLRYSQKRPLVLVEHRQANRGKIPLRVHYVPVRALNRLLAPHDSQLRNLTQQRVGSVC